jgi:hypothetical protein
MRSKGRLLMNLREKRIAILSPVAWRTPPRAYGPWETVAGNIAEGLTARGWPNITLFAAKDSITSARLVGFIDRGYEEDKSQVPLVSSCLHISQALQRAGEFDLIHNNFDYLPLTYTPFIRAPMLTTIHGFSEPDILRTPRDGSRELGVRQVARRLRAQQVADRMRQDAHDERSTPLGHEAEDQAPSVSE